MVSGVGMFRVITDADWKISLRQARAYKNSISAQIKMKLHPCNPTPGYSPKANIHMITFEPITSVKGVEPNVRTHLFYACKSEGKTLGYLHPDHTGIYNLYPNHLFGMNWTSSVLKEIAFKMDALNLPQAIEASD